MAYSRFAIYYVPPKGQLSDFGAKWLGWDVMGGCDVHSYAVPGLDDVTMTPRKYGFHGTLKPPFRLATGTGLEQLTAAVSKLAGKLKPAECKGLELTPIGGFVALTPVGDIKQLQQIAEGCVRDLDPFRAPPSEAELARRRAVGLSQRQDALLVQWGYPYVLEEFRFHMTLTERLAPDQTAHWMEVVQNLLPELPAPFVVDRISLCGERDDGRFELIHSYALTG